MPNSRKPVMAEHGLLPSRVAVALLHHPVYDKNRQVVTTAVTNLDIHDIARTARTFGLFRYYVVNPVPEQQALTERIRLHWLEGWGAGYNPRRKEALELLRVMPGLADAISDLTGEFGEHPLLVVTGARADGSVTTVAQLQDIMAGNPDRPCLLLFGTGWGLTGEIFEMADIALEPIRGCGDYNHLPVRAAVAIYLDRLFGRG